MYVNRILDPMHNMIPDDLPDHAIRQRLLDIKTALFCALIQPKLTENIKLANIKTLQEAINYCRSEETRLCHSYKYFAPTEQQNENSHNPKRLSTGYRESEGQPAWTSMSSQNLEANQAEDTIQTALTPGIGSAKYGREEDRGGRHRYDMRQIPRQQYTSFVKNAKLQRHKGIWINVTVGGNPVTALLDTGTDVLCVKHDIIHGMQKKYTASTTLGGAMQGWTTNANSCTSIQLGMPSVNIAHTFTVCTDLRAQMLLGADFFEEIVSELSFAGKYVIFKTGDCLPYFTTCAEAQQADEFKYPNKAHTISVHEDTPYCQEETYHPYLKETHKGNGEKIQINSAINEVTVRPKSQQHPQSTDENTSTDNRINKCASPKNASQISVKGIDRATMQILNNPNESVEVHIKKASSANATQDKVKNMNSATMRLDCNSLSMKPAIQPTVPMMDHPGLHQLEKIEVLPKKIRHVNKMVESFRNKTPKDDIWYKKHENNDCTAPDEITIRVIPMPLRNAVMLTHHGTPLGKHDGFKMWNQMNCRCYWPAMSHSSMTDIKLLLQMLLMYIVTLIEVTSCLPKTSVSPNTAYFIAKSCQKHNLKGARVEKYAFFKTRLKEILFNYAHILFLIFVLYILQIISLF